jgi:flagellar secretion chaperone FliS
MQRPHPCHSYRQVATQTATPGQLVLMLYEGAMRFLEQARKGFEHDDPLEFNRTINNNIQRAQAIIQELNDTLNLQAGGQVAATLRSLYEYMNRRLHQSNQTKSMEGIMDVLKRLEVLRDAWAQMLQQLKADPEAETTLTLSAAA